ncbi:class A sortase [Enterococcus faecalis]|nr:class A sortase [Enterococcus faecalis]
MRGLLIKVRRLKLLFGQMSKRKKIAVYTTTVILIVGLVVLGVFIKHFQFSKQVNELQQEALIEMQQKVPDQRVIGNYSGEDIEPLQSSHLPVDPVELIDKYGVGFIRIPAVGMELPILEGITQANISIGVGTVKANQQIGKGNFALLGHYMTSQELLFGSLQYVSVGDEIEITFYGKEATYVVQETRVIQQSEGQYMLDDLDDSHWLTLLTCHSDRIDSDYRIMVRATVNNS